MSFFGMFIQFVLGLLVTVILCYQVPQFPPLWVGGLLVILMTWVLWFIALHKSRHFYFTKRTQTVKQSLFTVSIKNRLFHLLLSVIIGMNLVFWQAFFSPKIPNEVFNHKNILDIKVLSLPVVVESSHFTKISFKAAVANIALTNHQTPSFKSNQKPIQKLSYVINTKLDKPRIYQAWYINQPIIKLSWYLNKAEFQTLTQQSNLPKVGQVWQFYAKLKANHASMNMAGRDYEAWLFQNHISAKATASGLVIKKTTSKYAHFSSKPISTAIKLKEASSLDWRVWRASAVDYLNKLFIDSPFKAIYLGLLVGDKSAINNQQWMLFQQTGTIHLMAISGLHMSIVALMGFLLFKLMWRWFFYRYQIITLPTFGAIGGLLFATVYLFISGASIPTQRAWIMVATVLGFLLIRRQFQPWSALAVAAFLVVVWDSRSVLSSGFWLSFLAVSFIFLGLKLFQDKANWQKLIAMQVMLTAGLAPLLLYSFYQVPLYGLLANLVAVPFVTTIGLPGLIVVIISSVFSAKLADSLREVMDWFWQQLWDFLIEVTKLTQFANHEYINVVTSQHSLGWVFAVSGILIICIWLFNNYQQSIQQKTAYSRGYFLLAILGYFLVVSLYPYSPERPINNFGNLSDLNKKPVNQNAQAWLSVLDVGQGQSIVIETANHVVVYDTGAPWGPNTDAAKVALIPYLKSQGWPKIDLLMVSHSDIDHAGGTPSVYKAFKIDQAVSGQPDKVNGWLNRKLNPMLKQISNQNAKFNQRFNKNNNTLTDKTSFLSNVDIKTQPNFTLCHAGQSWFFDGIVFEVLSPFTNTKSPLKSDNDLSCVLRVSNNDQAWLITGDLSKKGERYLIKQYQTKATKLNQQRSQQPSQQSKHSTVLKANLLVAGHHGSKTSTSQAWLNTVQPNKVVFSSGYLNRYRFPSKQVIKRVQQQKTPPIFWWNTACSGGVSFEMNQSGSILRYQARKKKRKWYHHSCLASEQGIYFQ